MSREIKFRAWDKEKEKMYTGPYDTDFCIVIMLPNLVQIHEKGEEQKFVQGDYLGQRFDLLQFTGLHDRNGKEIYEGDIIRWLYPLKSKEEYAKNPYKQVVVQWMKKLAGFNSFNHEEGEIIGNIFQNKDLLEEAKK